MSSRRGRDANGKNAQVYTIEVNPVGGGEKLLEVYLWVSHQNCEL